MIKVLSKHIADKIAAGEVVDRPVSIVKELVENAIDSGADSITVEIKDGGKSYIRVSDNGCGIEKDDIETAFLRHATSKISAVKDLDEIKTLGFRGEALASIAAVSHIEMISKTSDAVSGSMLNIHGGNVFERKSTGCPEGTTIIVTKLFYNTPARLKFLKSNATESSLIIDFVSKMALAYAGIKFRMINNGSILFATNGKNDRYHSILTIYNKTVSDNLMTVKSSSESMNLEAYISRPDFNKTNRKQQITFVNGRLVSSKMIEAAIEDGYRERLFEGRYPIVYLFLNVSPELLDVNIHPNKKEVRFHREEDVKKFIVDSIRGTLLSIESMPKVMQENISAIRKSYAGEETVERQADKSVVSIGISEKISDSKAFFKEDFSDYHTLNNFEDGRDYDFVDIKKISSTILEEEREKAEEFHRGEQESLIDRDQNKSFFEELHITGAIFNTYVTGVFKENFYLIDQHAAHERIFYEKFLKEYKNGEKIHQSILLPIIKEVPYTLKASEELWVGLLEKMGYNLESFGAKSYRITEIPVFMELSEAEAVLDYFLENIRENKDIDNEVKINKLITRSCKAAVKGNDKLSMEELNYLIKELSRCENPYSCPHGRPTFIKMNKYDIEKMFKRV